MKAVNWDTPEDVTNIFWNQNVQQFWTATEFNVSKDLRAWNQLLPVERDTYVKVLAGLTGLDTLQANSGMPLLALQTKDLRHKAVMGFMSMMEQIHAMSYSQIFTTLLPTSETKYLLEEWVPSNEMLSEKERLINYFYNFAHADRLALYMGYVSSVFLESFLFYSGFYYPLYLAGQGKMVASGEIIKKIIMDESIHGAFIGVLAQDLFSTLSNPEKFSALTETKRLYEMLLGVEDQYIEEIYTPLGLVDDVKNFTRYNLNKALQNLGHGPSAYEVVPVNPIVLNGLSTNTGNHDFFSTKGNGYVTAKKTEELTDEDFVF